MKNFFLLTLVLATSSLFAQVEEKSQDENKISKHEIGIKINRVPDFTVFSNPQYVWQYGLSSLSYHYYRSEKNILHFSGSFARNGDFFSSYGLSFFNEKRTYLGSKEKWFLSRGFSFGASYTEYDYSTISNLELIDGSYLSTNLGYSLGAGYRINKHFNLSTRLTPSVIYNHSLRQDNSQIKNWRFTTPVQLGINYRF